MFCYASETAGQDKSGCIAHENQTEGNSKYIDLRKMHANKAPAMVTIRKTESRRKPATQQQD
jgi:hypothetical protein